MAGQLIEERISETIPSNTEMTFLIRVEPIHEIGSEEVTRIIAEGLFDIESLNNFRVNNIVPYFDCFFPNELILKVDIRAIRPILADRLAQIFNDKLRELSLFEYPIGHLYCPPIIRILR